MPDVIRLLADYDQLLEPKLFDPKTLKREFKIAGVDHGVIFLAPAIAKISELAPGVSVDMTEKFTRVTIIATRQEEGK